MKKPGRPSPPIAGKGVNQRPRTETPLSLWLKANQMGKLAFARMLGCEIRSVKLWASGRCLPTLPYAFKMEQVTRGGVPAASWLGTPLGREVWSTLGNGRKAE